MGIRDALLNELERESANTRKLLERVPFEKSEWRPHEKSEKLHALAQHIANIPIWVTRIAENDFFDFAGVVPKLENTKNVEELLTLQAQSISEAKQALNALSEEDLTKMWSMKHGEKIVNTLTKETALRNMAFNHLIHHRAQLGVYLRLLGVPIPGTYGPSADDKR